MMHQRKSKKIFIYFFLLFLFGSINNVSIQKNKLTNLLKEIEILTTRKKQSKKNIKKR